jgi:hypothetical protein
MEDQAATDVRKKCFFRHRQKGFACILSTDWDTAALMVGAWGPAQCELVRWKTGV